MERRPRCLRRRDSARRRPALPFVRPADGARGHDRRTPPHPAVAGGQREVQAAQSLSPKNSPGAQTPGTCPTVQYVGIITHPPRGCQIYRLGEKAAARVFGINAAVRQSGRWHAGITLIDHDTIRTSSHGNWLDHYFSGGFSRRLRRRTQTAAAAGVAPCAPCLESTPTARGLLGLPCSGCPPCTRQNYGEITVTV